MASDEDRMDETNPDHYKKEGIETIDYIRACLSPQQFDGYLAGNILKYVSRYKEKNPQAPEADLKKAQWYLTKLIEEYDNDK